MLNRNESNFLCRKEKNFNLFIKLYRSIKLLTIIRIRKLPILCLIYFVNIQASNISACGKEANVKDVLITIKKKNGTEIRGNGIINKLSYKAKLKTGKRTCDIKIKRLEFNGVDVVIRKKMSYVYFSRLEINKDGMIEGEDENGNMITENELSIEIAIFKATIKIKKIKYETYLYFKCPNELKYNDAISSEILINTRNAIIYLPSQIKKEYFPVKFDNKAGDFIDNQGDTLKTKYIINFTDQHWDIKISNMKNKGYIYYNNTITKKSQRVISIFQPESESKPKLWSELHEEPQKELHEKPQGEQQENPQKESHEKPRKELHEKTEEENSDNKITLKFKIWKLFFIMTPSWVLS